MKCKPGLTMQHKNVEQKPSQSKKSFDPRSAHNQNDRCSKYGDSTHLEGFQCPAKRYQCKSCHKFGHFTSLCFMKGQQKQAYHKPHKPKAHQLTAGTIQAYDSQTESDSSDNYFCFQLQIKCVQAQSKIEKKPACLITNLLFRLKQTKIFTWEQDWILMLMLTLCQHRSINWYSMTQTWKSLHLASCRFALTQMTLLRL